MANTERETMTKDNKENIMKLKLNTGNSLSVLKTLPDFSVDSIVTDPPYELGFMGKKWDSTGIAYNKELWEECLRVLKPGGHLLAFSGTRTYHRMTCAIEDAGFEIRDQIQWIYASGFPKSTDVSKQIDKLDAKDERLNRNYRFTEWMRTTGLNSSQIDKITNTNMGGHYLTKASQPAVPTIELFNLLKPHITIDIPDWVEDLVNERTVESQNFKNREVIGKHENPAGTKGNTFPLGQECNITKPSTPDAIKWQGWGTALKPANEPICVARKPFKTTVAENVLKYGVGAMNIDESRVGNEAMKSQPSGKTSRAYQSEETTTAGGLCNESIGRWPANVIHDGSEEVVSLFPHTKSTIPSDKQKNGGNFPEENTIKLGLKEIQRTGFNDNGSAARFFYCAKASKKDRNEGLEGFELKSKVFNGQSNLSTIDGFEIGSVEDKFSTKPQANNHPTVKPTDLMAYLVRLVTPPGGTVLDPFNGSGSTGKACARLGFNYIGIDLSQEYIDISKARIEHELSKTNKEALIELEVHLQPEDGKSEIQPETDNETP